LEPIDVYVQIKLH